MKIGLFGFTTDHENMGCQALTCAFVSILEKLVVDEEPLNLVIFGGGCGLGKMEELFPNISFEFCEALLKKPVFIRKVRECDIVFDETFGDGFSDIYFGKEEYKDILKKRLAEVFSCKFVLTPQTYGPFADSRMERFAGRVIRKADYVFSRDGISADYAEQISGRAVHTVSDLAFALPFQALPKREKSIGLNVSGLLWQGGFDGKDNQFGLKADYRMYCREIVKEALTKGYEVHIIPHVTKTVDTTRISPDGDYPACEALHGEFPETILAPCFETPYAVKNYIASMSFFIGARMHSTIASFSSGVITIPFAYSRKFQGLYESLGYPYFVDGKSLDTHEAIQKTMLCIDNTEPLRLAQEKSMEIVRSSLNAFETELKEMLF